jgi:hypothetical protein
MIAATMIERDSARVQLRGSRRFATLDVRSNVLAATVRRLIGRRRFD